MVQKKRTASSQDVGYAAYVARKGKVDSKGDGRGVKARLPSPALLVCLEPDGSLKLEKFEDAQQSRASKKHRSDAKHPDPAFSIEALEPHETFDDARDAYFRSLMPPFVPDLFRRLDPEVSRRIGKLYKDEFDIRLTELTEPSYYEVAKLGERIGAGGFSEIRRVVIDGRSRAFKIFDKSYMHDAQRSKGLQQGELDDNDMGGRLLTALAIQQVDRALGFNLTLPVELAVISVAGSLKVGLLMDEMVGSHQYPWKDLPPGALEDPRVIFQLNGINCIDIMTLQADRYYGRVNMFMSDTKDGWVVRAYDNEDAFSITEDDAQGIYVNPPPVLTRSQADAIGRFGDQAMRRCVKVFDAMIDEADKVSCVKGARHGWGFLNRHIEKLEYTGHVVADAQWPAAVRSILARNSNWEGSYRQEILDVARSVNEPQSPGPLPPGVDLAAV